MKTIFSDNWVTPPHWSWPSTAKSGWHDLSPKSRPNVEPLRSTHQKRRLIQDCVVEWHTGSVWRDPEETSSHRQQPNKVQRCQTWLWMLKAQLPGPQGPQISHVSGLRDTGVSTPTGPRDTGVLYQHAPLYCFLVLATNLTLTEMVTDNKR